MAITTNEEEEDGTTAITIEGETMAAVAGRTMAMPIEVMEDISSGGMTMGTIKDRIADGSHLLAILGIEVMMTMDRTIRNMAR